MQNIHGEFIGHSVVQKDYLTKVRNNTTFKVRGKTLICFSAKYPVAMAEALGVFPKNCQRIYPH